ncbi:MAG: hypothetical protein HZC48_05030 [Nitrospirae bacterium]|nr:hypothetical protein [Nitrospirota bacterium]
MATSTTTIRTITTTCGAFGAESDRLYSFRSLHDAYVSCRRRKRNTINALRFEASLLDNLTDLSSSLQDGSYSPSRSVCFVAKQPKLREIFAADFRDRVVHHLLVPQIEKIFEPKFIHDSYACRTGKGTHAAVERLKIFMHRVTKSGRVAAWFMQLDIRSFFMSIDREILMGILEKNVRKGLNNRKISPDPSLPKRGIKDENASKRSDTPLNPLSRGKYLEIPSLANGETTFRQCRNLNSTLLKRDNACDPTLKKGGEGGFYDQNSFADAILRLAEIIVNQDCTKDYVYKGDPSLLKGIPPHKSLFTIPPGKGLPIGNLTSQFFGNVYLNELDQFVKHTLKARHYLRYVDDFILLDTNRERLLEMKEKIAKFLNEKLALQLKPETTLKRVSEGANFLGYIVRPDYVLVRDRVIGNLRARLRSFEEEMVQAYQKISPNPSLPKRGTKNKNVSKRNNTPLNPLSRGEYLEIPTLAKGGEGGFFRIHLREEKVRQLRQTLASYLGHFKYANSYKLTRSLFEKYEYLKYVFAINDEGRLVSLYEPTFEPANLRRQYRWAMEQYPEHCIFFQVGKFCEFYGEQAERYGRFFGLSPLTPTLSPKGRGRNFDIFCGFPVRHLKAFKAKALNAGLPYVVVGERGYYPSGLKKRVITEIFRECRVSQAGRPAAHQDTILPTALLRCETNKLRHGCRC